MSNKLVKFNLLGYEAILLNGRIEVSVPDPDTGSKILLKLSNAILDKKILSLRINLPDKIIFVSAHDKNSLNVRAEESDNKRQLN